MSVCMDSIEAYDAIVITTWCTYALPPSLSSPFAYISQLEYRFVESSQGVQPGTPFSASSLSEWAHRLVETFYGADADMHDDDAAVDAANTGSGILGFGVGATSADVSSITLTRGSVPPLAQQTPFAGGGLEASPFSAAAAAPGAGRGSSAVLPAWMTRQ
jgi:hypothetical protein